MICSDMVIVIDSAVCRTVANGGGIGSSLFCMVKHREGLLSELCENYD